MTYQTFKQQIRQSLQVIFCDIPEGKMMVMDQDRGRAARG